MQRNAPADGPTHEGDDSPSPIQTFRPDVQLVDDATAMSDREQRPRLTAGTAAAISSSLTV